MFQRFFIIGVVGVIGLVSGCSSWPSSTSEKTPTAAHEQPPSSREATSALNADKTKQVTIAVTGMT